MSDEDVFNSLLELLNSGRKKEAVDGLFGLLHVAKEPISQMQVIDVLLGTLDPIDERDQLIKLSGQGIKLARDERILYLQAYFMARRADLLATKIDLLTYRLRNLKLAPGWIEFSLVQEKNEYTELEHQIQEMEKETDSLLEEGLEIAYASKVAKSIAQVYMSKASVDSSRYLRLKIDNMKNRLQSKIWLNFPLMRRPFLERIFIFRGDVNEKLKALLESFISNYLKAAVIYRSVGDSGEGYAYNNLAVHLKSAYLFKRAKKYARIAKKVALAYNDELLLKRVLSTEKSIAGKNKDIPDYINGERRFDE